jgi:tetratricopeptide (TPR) repeat protein
MTGRTILAVLAAAVCLLGADPKVTAARKLMLDGKYKEAIEDLDKQAKAHPDSTEIKAALADAHYASGEYFLKTNDLPPREKYPNALKEYRAVLTYEKDSKRAQARISQIEAIYAQMGRKPPE